MDLWRLSRFDYNPTHWAAAVAKVAGLAWHRSQGRDAILYIGGVSFSVLLAVFPALAILVGIYSLVMTPDEAAAQAEVLARILPPGAQGLVEAELARLARAPMNLVSVQSVVAILIALYAAQKGVKALLAGLSLIHQDEKPRSFVGLNVFALGVALAGFAFISIVSGAFLAIRVLASTFDLTPFAGLWWVFSEWTWASVIMMLVFTLIYRWGMSGRPVAWRASLTGGAVAALACLFASWISAFYVQQIAHMGAAYGSIAAVVILLIWISWNVNAVFYGGALATELEIIIGRRELKYLEDLRGRKPKTLPSRSK